MGYRSAVMAVIYPDGGSPDEYKALYAQLKVLMATTFKDIVDEWFGQDMTWVDSDCTLKFDIPGVKWYDSYADVQAFHAMLAQFESDEIPGYCTEFIRIGEDDDDVHVERSGQNNQYYLGVSRSISCNV